MKTGKTLTLEEAFQLSLKRSNLYYRKHINAGLFGVYKILGFTDMDVESAEGTEIRLKDGRKILDFTSGFGILALGHNHPRIIEAERACHKRKTIDVLKMGFTSLQSALAYNIAQLMPGDLDTSFFTVSGAEANEAAIKLVTRAQPRSKKLFIRMKDGYHGKTHGAVSFTDSENFGEGFYVGIPPENVLTIPFGSIPALKQAIEKNSNQIIAVLLETIQGQEIVVPHTGYLTEVVRLCRENEIYSIFDEVKVGMGRSGKLFSFMYEDCVPDVVTISKAMGGGKRAIGAMVTSRALSKKAYGKKKDSAIHTTTFNGLGESCAVAIETLNILSDEAFLKEVREKSDYFFAQLGRLKTTYPDLIEGIRGRGLFIGIEFNFKPFVTHNTGHTRLPFANEREVVFMGSIVRSLYRDYGMLTNFSGPKPHILTLMPPLTITKSEIDRFIYALESVMKKGLSTLFFKFAYGNVAEAFRAPSNRTGNELPV